MVYLLFLRSVHFLYRTNLYEKIYLPAISQVSVNRRYSDIRPGRKGSDV